MENNQETQATNLQVFNNPEFGDVRVNVDKSGEPLFCLTDVCEALGIANNRNVKKRLDERGVHSMDTPTTNQFGAEVMQELTFINEPNLYRCIFRSDKPEAKQFQDWVFGEVLPQIRKNGAYVASKGEETSEELMARALVAANEALKRNQSRLSYETTRADMECERAEKAEKKTAELQPKADYTDEVLMSDSTYTFTQVSKDLGFRSVYQFETWLIQKNVIYRQSGQWLPTSRMSGKGFFATRTARYFKSDGTPGTSLSTVITEKGRMAMHQSLDMDRRKAAEAKRKGGEA